jgi:uncharacterized DUF497 family protein
MSMTGRIIWDDGNWPKCGKHGVSKAEIGHVLTDPATVFRDDPYVGEPRFRAIGTTPAGRRVFVVFAMPGDAYRPISARYMHKKEFDSYV